MLQGADPQALARHPRLTPPLTGVDAMGCCGGVEPRGGLGRYGTALDAPGADTAPSLRVRLRIRNSSWVLDMVAASSAVMVPSLTYAWMFICGRPRTRHGGQMLCAGAGHCEALGLRVVCRVRRECQAGMRTSWQGDGGAAGRVMVIVVGGGLGRGVGGGGPRIESRARVESVLPMRAGGCTLQQCALVARGKSRCAPPAWGAPTATARQRGVQPAVPGCWTACACG